MTTFSIYDQLNELVKVTLSQKQALTKNSDSIQQEMTDRSAKSPDFSQDNNPSEKSERKCTRTRIKSRHFLSNISYVGINKEDLLVTKNLNPFSLDRKLTDKNKHGMIYMPWKECMTLKFYRHICKEKIFLYLNGKNVLQPKVSEMITEFLKEGDENYIELRNKLSQYKNIFFFYVFIQMFSLKLTARRKGEILTSKLTFTLCLKLTRTRKTLNH